MDPALPLSAPSSLPLPLFKKKNRKGSVRERGIDDIAKHASLHGSDDDSQSVSDNEDLLLLGGAGNAVGVKRAKSATNTFSSRSSRTEGTTTGLAATVRRSDGDKTNEIREYVEVDAISHTKLSKHNPNTNTNSNHKNNNNNSNNNDDDDDENNEKKKLYRGLANVAHSVSTKYSSGGSGPKMAPSHLRPVSFFDYKPDICKDYKETGNCGYGDACVFLHDRSDYKMGWQIEKEWELEQKQKKRSVNDGSDEIPSGVDPSSTDIIIPPNCSICQQSMTAPVITRCQHYFCEACALAHHRQPSSSGKCYVCQEVTQGIFTAVRAAQPKRRRDGDGV